MWMKLVVCIGMYFEKRIYVVRKMVDDKIEDKILVYLDIKKLI